MVDSTQKNRYRFGVLRRIFGRCEKNIYFISGMCYNCSVFDKLKLPKGFKKHYLEWIIPAPDETLEEYAAAMARHIDRRKPFVLVGYSFGAVVMQEMNKTLNPEKSVIISSFKSREEIPALFSAVRHIRLADYVPKKLYQQTGFISNAFNQLVYQTSTDELSQYMTVTDPAYVKWAVEQITNWIPDHQTAHLYHIHGTHDQVFPFKQIRDVMPVEGGDHLMIIKKSDTVSALLDSILLIKEQ